MPRTADLAAGLVASRRCLGCTVFVWHDDETVLDSAVGEHADVTTPGELRCMVKPVVACCLARAVERGELTLDDPVSRWIPEFTGGRRDATTLRRLLTHTSGLPDAWSPGPAETDVRHVVETICASPADGPWWGNQPVYNLLWSWHLIAAVLERLHGAPVETVLRREVADVAGLPSLRLVCPAGTSTPYYLPASRTPVSDLVSTRPNPAYGGFATLRDTGRFHVELLACLRGEGRLLSARMASAMTTRHSLVPFYQGGRRYPYGMGFFAGPDGVGLGDGWSAASFGSVGSIRRHTVTAALADPDSRTVVAVRLSSVGARNAALVARLGEAVRADLGLAPERNTR